MSVFGRASAVLTVACGSHEAITPCLLICSQVAMCVFIRECEDMACMRPECYGFCYDSRGEKRACVCVAVRVGRA